MNENDDSMPVPRSRSYLQVTAKSGLIPKETPSILNNLEQVSLAHSTIDGRWHHLGEKQLAAGQISPARSVTPARPGALRANKNNRVFVRLILHTGAHASLQPHLRVTAVASDGLRLACRVGTDFT